MLDVARLFESTLLTAARRQRTYSLRYAADAVYQDSNLHESLDRNSYYASGTFDYKVSPFASVGAVVPASPEPGSTTSVPSPSATTAPAASTRTRDAQ